MTEKISTGACVLITNAFIKDWSGSELYIRDLVLQRKVTSEKVKLSHLFLAMGTIGNEVA
jgi:hypothetical protein